MSIAIGDPEIWNGLLALSALLGAGAATYPLSQTAVAPQIQLPYDRQLFERFGKHLDLDTSKH